MDLGPHAVFIWSSYLAVVLALVGLVAWLIVDDRRRGQQLADLEARGIRRRTSGAGVADDPS